MAKFFHHSTLILRPTTSTTDGKCAYCCASPFHYCRGKATSVLVTQHADQKRSIFLSFVACPSVPYSSTLSHKRHDFRKNSIVHKMYVLIFSRILSEEFLIIRRNERDVIKKMYTGLRVKYPLFLSDFNET